MSDLRELYQEVIFDHNRNPQNFGKLQNPDRTVHGHNPLCGDQLTLYLQVDTDGAIRDIAFDGHGCAISVASASIMTGLVKGASAAEALLWFDRFHALVTGGGAGGGGDSGGEGMDKLAVLGGVRQYPMRVKCATLPWHTLQAALRGDGATVSTE